MVTVPPPRRVPFVRNASVSADRTPLARSLDTENLSSLEIKRKVKSFLVGYSSLPKLQGCATRYLPQQRTWNACAHPLCWQCAHRRAHAASADLRRRSTEAGSLLMLRLSLASDASQSLEDAWDALEGVRASWSAGRAVRSRVSAYRWHTELTRNADDGSWNVHLHLILGTTQKMNRDDAQLIVDALTARWVECAIKRGRYAAPEALHGALIDRTPARAIAYICKGVMAPHRAVGGSGRTPSDILLSAAMDGDADDAALWLEIESASDGRHFQGTGGAWRGGPKP